MKVVRRASVLFAVGSSAYWMLASIIQYRGMQPIFDAPQEPAASVVALIGILPLVVYSLICLFTFRWLERTLRRTLTPSSEKQDD